MKYQNRGKGGASAPPYFPIYRSGLVAVLLLLSGILIGMGTKPPQVSGPAPGFQAETLEGKPVSLSDYKGTVVVLTFWATWCEPCKKEMPEIQAAYEKYNTDGFTVLAINFGEKREGAEAFVKKMGLTFPSLLDRQTNIAERYGVVSLPVTFFIDREGIIRERVFGGTLTAEGIGQSFQKIR